MSHGPVLRWVRTGLGAAVTQPNAPAAPHRPPLPLTLQVRRDGAIAGEVAADGLSLLGPGDVTGIDQRGIAGCWPPPESAGVSAADLAYVEFADPAVPWLVTPFGPDPAGNLVPWLALVVVPQDRASLTAGAAHLVLETTGDELPPWSTLHAWAHVQILDPAVSATDRAALGAAATERGRAVARLLCPRRLDERTTYIAALVPTFAVGVDAALGNPLSQTAAPAWAGTPDPVRLPVYYSWRFTTGAAATFEDLAAALRPLDGGPTAVGADRRLAVDQAGRSLPPQAPLPIGGALRVGPAATPPGYDATALRAERASTVDIPAPTWGDWHAEGAPAWLSDLNDWPPYRVAAGLGAAAVRTHQEQLMAAAWEQAGQWAEADEQLRHAQAALGVMLRAYAVRVAPLMARPGLVLQLAAPAAARMTVAAQPPRSLAGRIATTCMPLAAISAPARRVLRPDGRLARRAAASRDGLFDRSAFVSAYAAGAPTHAPTPGAETVRVPLQRIIGSPIPKVPNLPRVRDGVEFIRPMPTVSTISTQPHIDAAIASWHAASTAAGASAPCTTADVPALSADALAALHPQAPLSERVATRIDVAASPVSAAQPTAISRLRVGPRFDIPAVDLLTEQGADWLLPAASNIPDDRLVLADPDPAFIEAFLVGANHEISRELLWRNYPADRGASGFTRFWDRRQGTSRAGQDVPDLNYWQGRLGDHLDPAARMAVLVARGRLFRDYPDLVIYAHRAVLDKGVVRPAPVTDEASLSAYVQQPVLRHRLAPDIELFGFTTPTADLAGTGADPGWFVVLAEPPSGTRFGLAQQPAATVATWSDLSWADVTVSGAHLDPTAMPARTPTESPPWAPRSDALAAILRRMPFRLFIHASRLLPNTGP